MTINFLIRGRGPGDVTHKIHLTVYALSERILVVQASTAKSVSMPRTNTTDGIICSRRANVLLFI